MLEIPIESLGNPGTFDITDKSDPQYYIARYAHEMSMNLYKLELATFKWRQEENTDLSSIITNFDTYAGDVATWFITAVQEACDGDPITGPPAIPSLPVLWLPGILVSLFWRLVINVLMKWLHKKLDPATEATELIRLLKQIFIGEVDGEEYSLIHLLDHTPIEIIISRAGEYQDFLYTDQPET